MGNAPPVALVTAGAKRVGRAIVEKLANSGFDIAFTFHSSVDEANGLVRSLQTPDRKIVAIPADLGAFHSIEMIHETVMRQFGRLDALVNNASIYRPTPLEGDFNEIGQDMFNIHVTTPLRLCRLFAPQLRAARGRVINMVDLLAERPWPEYLLYCASKAALANLTLGLARELAPEVTVNGVAPGVVAWPDDFPQDQRDNYLKRVPLGRAGTPQDVANLVHFLATDGFYITGQILRLDGGRSIT